MPNYLLHLRPSAMAATLRTHLRSFRRSLSKFARPQSFSLPHPPTLSSARARLSRNLSFFKIHYLVLLWICLLFSLAPHHKPTMLFLMAASKVALFYEVLLKAVPTNWRLLRRVLDRRLMMGFFLGAVLVELGATGALGRLGVAMGVGVPVTLLHGLFFRAEGEGTGSDLEGDADPIGGAAGGGEKKDDVDLEQ